MAATSTTEPPQIFLLHMPSEEGGHLIVCEACLAIRESELPEPVGPQILSELHEAAKRQGIVAARLPNAGESMASSWVMLQLSTPKGPPPPRPPRLIDAIRGLFGGHR